MALAKSHFVTWGSILNRLSSNWVHSRKEGEEEKTSMERRSEARRITAWCEALDKARCPTQMVRSYLAHFTIIGSREEKTHLHPSTLGRWWKADPFMTEWGGGFAVTRGCCGDVDVLWRSNLWPSGYRVAAAEHWKKKTLNLEAETDVGPPSGSHE